MVECLRLLLSLILHAVDTVSLDFVHGLDWRKQHVEMFARYISAAQVASHMALFFLMLYSRSC